MCLFGDNCTIVPRSFHDCSPIVRPLFGDQMKTSRCRGHVGDRFTIDSPIVRRLFGDQMNTSSCRGQLGDRFTIDWRSIAINRLPPEDHWQPNQSPRGIACNIQYLWPTDWVAEQSARLTRLPATSWRLQATSSNHPPITGCRWSLGGRKVIFSAVGPGLNRTS